MAGYSVGGLFHTDRDFFARWVKQAGVGEAYDDDPTHPRPEQRASFVRSQLASVVGEIDFFDFGVRLAQLGRYDDAIVLLERFRDSSPGREVLSNLGYAHYQLATKLLAACDGAPAVRFRLPVAIDDETPRQPSAVARRALGVPGLGADGHAPGGGAALPRAGRRQGPEVPAGAAQPAGARDRLGPGGGRDRARGRNPERRSRRRRHPDREGSGPLPLRRRQSAGDGRHRHRRVEGSRGGRPAA